jgi:hypothetical protein
VAQAQARPAQQAQQAQQAQPQRTQQQARTWQQKQGWLQPGGWQGHATWQQDRSQNWASDHRTWEQRGGYGGFYIPQATYNLSFGNDHFFRLRALPSIYMGYPRFAYGGYSFLLLDPWPGTWSVNWFDTDDLYIDYDDGYYLYDRNYPYVRLAVTVSV